MARGAFVLLEVSLTQPFLYFVVQARLVSLQDQLKKCPRPLIPKQQSSELITRELIRQDELRVVSPKERSRLLFLFNDALLWSSHAMNFKGWVDFDSITHICSPSKICPFTGEMTTEIVYETTKPKSMLSKKSTVKTVDHLVLAWACQKECTAWVSEFARLVWTHRLTMMAGKANPSSMSGARDSTPGTGELPFDATGTFFVNFSDLCSRGAPGSKQCVDDMT